MTTPRLTEEQARAAWRRAAELQAAAEQAATHARSLGPGEQSALSIEQVTAAAEGAGIGAEYIRVAVAEQGLPDVAELGHDDWRGRWLRRVTREGHAFEVERVVAAPPAAALAAFRQVAASAAYQLIPESTVGSDPLRDAVLVYRITSAGAFGSTMNFADARVLLVSIRAHEQGAVVRVRVPLFRRGINLVLTGVSASLFGGGGGALFGAVAGVLGATAAAFAVPVAAGVAAGAGVGAAAFRGLYRSLVRSAEGAIRQLLQAVALEAERAAVQAPRLDAGSGTPGDRDA